MPDAALVHQDEVAVRGVRVAGLVIRILGQRGAWTAADVNDRIRQRRLLRTSDYHDSQLEHPGAGLIVVAWDGYGPAFDPGGNVWGWGWQVARCPLEDGRNRPGLADRAVQRAEAQDAHHGRASDATAEPPPGVQRPGRRQPPAVGGGQTA